MRYIHSQTTVKKAEKTNLKQQSKQINSYFQERRGPPR